MKTASALPRYLNCPASYALRLQMARDGLLPVLVERSAGADAEAGTRRHRALEAAIDVGDLPDRFRPFVGDTPRTELAYRYDSATGVAAEMPAVDDRKYPPAPASVTYGTTDCVSLSGDDQILIVDWKGPHADLPPIESNEQLSFAALCASRVTKRPHVQIATVRIDDADMNADDDLPKIVGAQVAVVGPAALHVFEERLRRLDGEIAVAVRDLEAGREPLVIAGNHCAYCPAAPACPATHRALELASTPPDIVPHIAPALLVEMESAVAAAGKRLRQFIEAEVKRSGPIDLGDGYLYGYVVADGNEKIDATLAAPVLIEHLGLAAELAIKKTVVKTGIKAAAKEIAPKGKAAELERNVLAGLRNAGAISRDQTTSLKAYRAADALPATIADVEL